MKFTISPLIYGAIGINALCFLFVASNTISTRLNSQNQLTARQKGLQTVAEHYLSDHCWVVRSNESYKIGDLVETSGTLLGKIPTSCVKSPRTQQILHVAYANGQLIIQHIYSPRELRNQVSEIQKGSNNEK